MAGTGQVYKKLLGLGKAKKTCSVCSRHMNDSELAVFEKYVRLLAYKLSTIYNVQYQLETEMKKASPQAIAEDAQELEDWEKEHTRLQGLLPIQASRNRLKGTEIPSLQEDIQREEAAIPSISEKAEEVMMYSTCSDNRLTPWPRRPSESML